MSPDGGALPAVRCPPLGVRCWKMSAAWYPRRVRPTVLVLMLVVSATSPGAAGSSDAYGSFKTPSGNIVCEWLSSSGGDQIQCGIRSGLTRAHTVRCALGDPVTNRVQVSAAGPASRVLCAGDPGPLDPSVRASVLEYGQRWRSGAISCLSERLGLNCRNHAGHGFFLSRERWWFF
jgi:hypothetical protein